MAFLHTRISAVSNGKKLPPTFDKNESGGMNNIAGMVFFLKPLLVLALCLALFHGTAMAAGPVLGPIVAGPGDNIVIPDDATVLGGTDSAISAIGGQASGTGTHATGTSTDIETATVSAEGPGSLVSLSGSGTTIDAATVGVRMFSDGLARLGSGTVINISGVDDAGSGGLWVQSATPADVFGSGITVNINQSAPRTGIGAWIGVAIDSGGGAAFDNLTVQGSDVNLGVFADGSGTSLSLKDSSIAVNGMLGSRTGGIFFWPVNNVLGDVNEIGIASRGGAVIDLDNVSVTHTVSGTCMGFFSVDVGSAIKARNVSITMSGDGGFFAAGSVGGDAAGAYAAFRGAITLEDSRIAVSGNDFSGLHARGGVISVSNSAITTLGGNDSAIRFTLTDGLITLADTSLAALGPGNFGVIATDSASGALNMSGGSLSSTAQAIYIDNGDLQLTFRDGAHVTAGNGVLLEAASNDGSATITGDTGAVLAGDVKAAAQNSVHVSLNNSAAWTGAAGNIGDASVAGNALWTITGDSDARSLSLNNGSAVFSPFDDAAGYRILDVRGNFSSANGVVGLNAHLADSVSPSDRLRVQGDTSGSGWLRVTNTDGGGALTSGDGILVVEVQGVSGGMFTLQGRAAAGLYEYTLRKGANDGNWYLSSASPDEPDQPNIRPEAPLASVFVPMGIEYGYSMLGTLHERIGESRVGFNEAGITKESGRRRVTPWVRLLGDRLFHDANGDFMDHGASYDYSLGGVQAGMDIDVSGNAGGPKHSAGAYFGYGRMDADVDDARSGNAGSVDMDAYSLGVYWTRYNSADGSGLYSDLVLQGTAYNTRAESRLDGSFSSTGLGALASLETGCAFDLGQGIILEPQGQLAYQHVNFEDAKDAHGIFYFDAGSSLRGRLGLRLGRLFDTGDEQKPRQLSAWIRGNIWKEFLQSSKTTAANRDGGGQTGVTSRFDSIWGEAQVGLSGEISGNLSLFATGDMLHSLDGGERKGWGGRIGFRYEW